MSRAVKDLVPVEELVMIGMLSTNQKKFAVLTAYGGLVIHAILIKAQVLNDQ